MKDYVKNELNIPYETYFNSGLLLFNCEEYRKHKIAEKCMSFLTNNTQVKFVDQDALNVVCVNKAHFLNMQWNYQWHFELNNDSVPDYCKDQYKKAREHPFIVHYSSGKKPWNLKTANELTKLWKKYDIYENLLNQLKDK